MQIVRILGDVVELVEESPVKRTRLTEFLGQLTEQAGIRTPILPPGTIHYATQGRTSVFVIEVPPGRRKITYKPREGRGKEYEIRFPWFYLFACFRERALDRVYVYVTPEPVRKSEAVLCHPPLPNRHNDGLTCLGNFRFDVVLPQPERLQELVRYYFESTFTNEILESFNSYVPDEIAKRTEDGTQWLDGWARLSEADLASVQWKPFKSFGDTIQLVLERR